MEFSNIKLLIYDCDGVLTDNRVLVDETGRESVLFHRGDGYGIRMLKELGIEQMIVSTETNPIVARRAEKLKISVLHSVEDKKTEIIKYCASRGIALDQVMFIGNDLNDSEAMQAVGYCGCPRDAEPEIQDISNWVSSKNGGFGVIRELYRVLSAGRK